MNRSGIRWRIGVHLKRYNGLTQNALEHSQIALCVRIPICYDSADPGLPPRALLTRESVPVQNSCRFVAIFLMWSACLLLTGCLTPQNTRFPEPWPRDLRSEALSYRFHDPFPDESIGPGTASRPPSYQKQRDPARRAEENRILRGYNLERAPTGSLPPKTAWDYPDAVQAN